MIPFLIGLIIGIAIGAVGTILISCFLMAKEIDEVAERIMEPLEYTTEVHYLSDNLKRPSVKENQ